MTGNLDSVSKLIAANKTLLVSKYHIKRIGIFGSAARNEQTLDSDIDALIELSKPISLLQYIDLQEYLETLLQAKVDVVTYPALKTHISKVIMQEVVFI
jgi:predicted nucleotidyltransferase